MPASPTSDAHLAHGAPVHRGAQGPVPHHKAASHAPGAGLGLGGHEAHLADYRRRFWVALGMTLAIVLLSPMIQHALGLGDRLAYAGELWVLAGLSTVLVIYGGRPFFGGMLAELRTRNPGMMTLVSVAIGASYAYSMAVVAGFPGEPLFWELATLITVFLLGHWVEMRSLLGASRALEQLVRLLPSMAHRRLPGDGQRWEDVSVEMLAPGDIILVRPGEQVPADGVILAGQSSVNEAMLTGESVPVFREAPQPVIAGAINGEGALEVEVQRIGKDAYLARVIDLVREAQQTRSRSQDLANRAARWLTLVAIGGGLVTLVVWAVWLGAAWDFAVERAVTVMVVACPHALGLAVPLVVSVSSALGAAQGLLIRNRVAFERARQLDAVIFDKTGTLTRGKFAISAVVPFDQAVSNAELLSRAASLESHSQHPIARAIADADSDGEMLPVREFRAISGQGVEGWVGKERVQVLSPGALATHAITLEPHWREAVTALEEDGSTVVVVVIDGQAKGAIAVADEVRPESAGAIRELREMGIHPIMLTGDNARVARRVSQRVGIEEFLAGVLPEDKARKVREIQARGLVVAMTGDGVNDAPALAQADVGIAVGAGTDVALETADIVLVRSSPSDVVALVGLAQRTWRKMVQNLLWALGYNVVALPLAAGVAVRWGVVLAPWVGAILMSASTVIVALNARMLRFSRGSPLSAS